MAQRGDILFGIAVGEGQRYANAGVSFGASPTQLYAKSHLVPFGEFVPPGFQWFLDLMRIPMGNFMSGPDRQPPLEIAGQKVAVNICYEDVFGSEIIRALPEATLLENLPTRPGSAIRWRSHSTCRLPRCVRSKPDDRCCARRIPA